MKITIISALNKDRFIPEQQKQLVAELEQTGNQVKLFQLDEMDIRSCTGCWGCWVKTPGKCFQKDDMELILKDMINSDLAIFYSPLVMGYVSGKMKLAMDRTIPLVHPYIEIVQGENHHRKRYKNYPKIGMIISGPENISREEIELTKLFFERYALNFKSDLRIYADPSVPTKEITDEINNI
ncbi:MAG: flavodoxin family protein [Acidobacteriota bacterium]